MKKQTILALSAILLICAFPIKAANNTSTKIMSQKDIVNGFAIQITNATREANELNSQLLADSLELDSLKLITTTVKTIIANSEAVINLYKIPVPTKNVKENNIKFMEWVKNFFIDYHKVRITKFQKDLDILLKSYSITQERNQEFIVSLPREKIIEKLLDKNCYDDPADPNRYFRDVTSPRQIDTIIIHNSFYFPEGDKNIKSISKNPLSVDGIIQVYSYYQVGPHYLIDTTGKIYKTIDEKYIAFHAGKSTMPSPDKREGVNKFSIGIELMGQEKSQPTQKQLEALKWLVQDINKRYPIKHVLGHDDISTTKDNVNFKNEVNNIGTVSEFIKTDPWNFPWHKFNLMMKDLETQYTNKQ